MPPAVAPAPKEKGKDSLHAVERHCEHNVLHPLTELSYATELWLGVRLRLKSINTIIVLCYTFIMLVKYMNSPSTEASCLTHFTLTKNEQELDHPLPPHVSFKLQFCMNALSLCSI